MVVCLSYLCLHACLPSCPSIYLHVTQAPYWMHFYEIWYWGVLLSPRSLIINQHVFPNKSSYLAQLNTVDGSAVFSKMTILENYAGLKDYNIEALCFLRLQYVS
jgi:hypothetical protein